MYVLCIYIHSDKYADIYQTSSYPLKVLNTIEFLKLNSVFIIDYTEKKNNLHGSLYL